MRANRGSGDRHPSRMAVRPARHERRARSSGEIDPVAAAECGEQAPHGIGRRFARRFGSVVADEGTEQCEALAPAGRIASDGPRSASGSRLPHSTEAVDAEVVRDVAPPLVVGVEVVHRPDDADDVVFAVGVRRHGVVHDQETNIVLGDEGPDGGPVASPRRTLDDRDAGLPATEERSGHARSVGLETLPVVYPRERDRHSGCRPRPRMSSLPRQRDRALLRPMRCMPRRTACHTGQRAGRR